jgi:hypothetical protein
LHGIEVKTYENVHSSFPRTKNADVRDSAVAATEVGVSFEGLLCIGFGVVFVVLIAAAVVVVITIYIRRRRPAVACL